MPVIKVSEHEGSGEEGENASGFAAAPEGLEKPGRVGVVEDKEGDKDGEVGEVVPGKSVDETMSFSTKRLCERWLDNLFMVLYEVSFLFFPFIPLLDLTECLWCLIGPPNLDDLPRRSRTLQDPTRRIQKDRNRMGDSG